MIPNYLPFCIIKTYIMFPKFWSIYNIIAQSFIYPNLLIIQIACLPCGSDNGGSNVLALFDTINLI